MHYICQWDGLQLSVKGRGWGSAPCLYSAGKRWIVALWAVSELPLQGKEQLEVFSKGGKTERKIRWMRHSLQYGLLYQTSAQQRLKAKLLIYELNNVLALSYAHELWVALWMQAANMTSLHRVSGLALWGRKRKELAVDSSLKVH